MKKLVFTAIFFIAISATAQKISKDSLVKIMANEVCNELSKQKDGKTQSKDLGTQIGLAMLPVFTNHLSEIQEVYEFTELTKENGAKVGEDIGAKLANICPAFLELLSKNPDATANFISGKKSNAGSLEGTLVKITKGDLSYIEVKTASGKIEKLYWLEYFEGSQDLISTPTKLNNKKVLVSYLEKEIYKAAINEYVKVKVITGLE